jgi:hypothetical protein
VKVVPGDGGRQGAFAVALVAANGNGRSIIAAGQPFVQGEQLLALTTKAVKPIETQIVGRSLLVEIPVDHKQSILFGIVDYKIMQG